MNEPVAGITPSVLKWARERSGYSVIDVATALSKTPDVVEQWEGGSSSPTYPQLEKLAYSLYKRPLAIFFLPIPPEERDPKKSFRTLPDVDLEQLLPDTLFAIREAQAYQAALRELTDGVNPSSNPLLSMLGNIKDLSISDLAVATRRILGISLDQQKRWRSTTDALSAWRDAIENSGIFIFKRSFKQKEVSGFCLNDKMFPIIVLNNSTAKQRQIFSLFHELAHLEFDTDSISMFGEAHFRNLPKNAQQLEYRCNEFAAELLVPDADFLISFRKLRGSTSDESVQELARIYRVSREVILRRFLDKDLVTSDDYNKRVEKWAVEAAQSKGSQEGGGDYYLTKAAYLGYRFLELAFKDHYQGKISIDRLADIVGVKAKNLPALESVVIRRTSFE